MSGGAVATITYSGARQPDVGRRRVRNVIVGSNCLANATAAPCVVEHLAGSLLGGQDGQPAGRFDGGARPDDRLHGHRDPPGEGPVARSRGRTTLSAVLDDATLVTPLPAGVTRTGNTLNWSGHDERRRCADVHVPRDGEPDAR